MAQNGIVDPHFHIWDLAQNDYPWLTERPQTINVAGNVDPIAQTYLIEDYREETKGQHVVKAVHVDAGWNYSDPVGETRWLQSVADASGFHFGIVARANLESPDAEQVLAAHCAHRNVRGIRQILNWHHDPDKTYIQRRDLMRDPAWRAGFGLLAGRGLSFDLQIYPSQMGDAVELARDFPETSIIVNHTGMPVDRDDAGRQVWADGISKLAVCPNVTIKLSGLGMLDWSWTTASIRPFILHAIDAFGPQRSMFASNFPVDRLYSSFDTLYDAYRKIVADFSDTDKDALFRSTAEKIYRL